MNDIQNIASSQVIGVTNTPKTDANALTGQQDLLGFLTALLQQLQGVAPSDAKDLKAKIADFLKDKGITADQLQTLQNPDLSAQLTALLQPVIADNAVKPALTSDLLAGNTSLDIQSIPDVLPKDDKKTDSIASLLSLIEPGSENKVELPKTAEKLLDPALLDKLRDTYNTLKDKDGKIKIDDLVKFTQDTMASLQEMGLDIKTAQAYAVAAAQEPKPAEITPAIVALVNVSAVGQQAKVSITPKKDLLGSDKLLNAEYYASADENTTDSITSSSNNAEKKGPSNSALNTQNQLNPAAANIPVTVVSKPTATQHLSAGILAMLTQNEGGFGGNSFSSDGFNNTSSNAQTSADNGLFKPITADMANVQNFTNYMNAARTAASPTTQMVAIQLQRNVNAKVDTMTIRLDPADMGHMDIQLKFDKEGKVKAHMIVDKPETLALLQKDSQHLERALQDTGLSADENSITFDLQQQASQQDNLQSYNSYDDQNARQYKENQNDNSIENAISARIAIASNGYITQSGVNIMV